MFIKRYIILKKEKSVFKTAFSDTKEKTIIDIGKLESLSINEVKINSRYFACVNVYTDNLYRGLILDNPIIDVIINDQYVKISGLVVGKIYDNMILSLEYIDGIKLYLLETFTLSNSDKLSEYICKNYKLAFKEDISEEEFNDWYFKIQNDNSKINDFIYDVLSNIDTLELDRFINLVYRLIFDKDIDNESFNYWKNFYEYELKSGKFERNIKIDIIDKIFNSKQI